ncbi:alpha/beta hydrolase [Kineococcus terrestris]|uniref:alpha/beta hydrolase n=1 Tax=Kineococcus terrestris TaxID=2044856 RepID=UPI0034DB0C1D
MSGTRVDGGWRGLEADGPHGPVPVRVHPGAGDGWLLWVHGGGFVAGDLDMHEADGVARWLAADAGLTVVTVDHRLATRLEDSPRWPVRWPVPSDDVLAAWDLVTTRAGGAPVHLGGCSAGANLAAGAVLRLLERGRAVPRSLVLAYPTLHVVQPPPGDDLAAALLSLPAQDGWGPEQVRGMYANLLGPALLETSGAGGEGAVDVPLAAVPGAARPEDVAAFPATYVLLGDVDGLRPSGEDFARTLDAAGVPVRVEVEEGTVHGHLNRPEEPSCARSLQRLSRWYAEHHAEHHADPGA